MNGMAIPAVIAGIVLGFFIGPFGLFLFAPLMTGGIILFLVFPPLRSIGFALFAMSIGLAIGMVISFLVAGWIVFGHLLCIGVIF